jgi:hypothetical protein
MEYCLKVIAAKLYGISWCIRKATNEGRVASGKQIDVKAYEMRKQVSQSCDTDV